MEKMKLAISLADGQTLYAEPRPEDERLLAELLGDGSTIDLGSRDDDLEGHAISGDVAVDVEGHAMVLRLPNASDAAAVRRALAVGVLTAAVAGSGVIASLNPPVPSSTSVVQAPERVQAQEMPGPALRAQRDQTQREQAQEDYVRGLKLQAVPLDVDNPAIPAQALRAEQAELQREQAQDVIITEQKLKAVPVDADNPAIPAPAKRAGTD